jgi:hypothetical protein
MFKTTVKRTVAALAVTAGLPAAAGPASAILHNGHAGLGANVYQHNQTDLEFAFSPQGPRAEGIADGTSNILQTALARR